MRSLTTTTATATLDQPSWNLIHQLVQQLEDGWRQGTPLSLDQFTLPLSGRSRERLLVELIKVDQDYRFQAGEPRLLESYFHEWPELATQHDAVVELLTAECVTRAAHQALPTREDLAARFPDHADAIDLSLLGAETRALSDTSHDDSIKKSAGFEPLPQDVASSGKPFGRYEIRSVLGRGGMGSVYRAYDTQLGREVALKVPRFDVIADPVVRERFVREAHLAASVRHPNVCPIHDVGEINGTYYISMSLVEGESLAAMLARGPLPAMQAAEIVRKLAQALTRVHEAGVIHRDIKPSNVLIDESGEPLLMDFGLARPTQPAADQLITTAGSLLGTPIFMSPEQVAGDSAAVDARTDIYSLGVVLYQSLTGNLPFSGSLTDVLVQIAHSDPPTPRSIRPDLDARLEAIVLKAIARRCEDRYQTPRELAVALEEWLRRQERLLDTQPIARPASDTATAARSKQVRIWLLTVALLPVVALAAVVIHVKTDKGTLEITSDDNEVSVVVEQAGKLVTVIDKKSGNQIKLPSGEYHLKLGDGADDLELIASEITLKRGKTTVATVRRISEHIAAEKAEDQAWRKSVATMKPEEQVKAVWDKLKERNSGFNTPVRHTIEGGRVTTLSFETENVTDISPVRALTDLQSLSCTGTYAGTGRLSDLSPLEGLRLTQLSCFWTQVRDLSPLRDMPLTRLSCGGTPVTDLSPLRGMPLQSLGLDGTGVSNLTPLAEMKIADLNCDGTKIRDLSPLKGMPLTNFACSRTQVEDLAPLKGTPLSVLNCKFTKVRDLSPLRELPLNNLLCDFEPERDADVLRSIKSLQTINSKPVAEFWKDVERQQQTPPADKGKPLPQPPPNPLNK